MDATSPDQPHQPQLGAFRRPGRAQVTAADTLIPLPYIRLPLRVALTIAFGLAWVAFSVWIAIPWIGDLADSITLPAAIIVIAGIAFLPGYLNANLLASVVLDRPPRLPPADELSFPRLTVLIAAYNEEDSIGETLGYLVAQDYPGGMEIIVIDDGSEDETAAVAEREADRDGRIRVLREAHGGKASALNAGLAETRTEVIATIDADTLLMPQSLRRAVTRLLVSPPDTVAVAGSVLVRNSRRNMITRMQEWDYFLGIATIKRQQALYQGTLVAQGSFSVYEAGAVRRAGGWQDRSGEDIVLTWALLEQGGRTLYEATAVAFTRTPTRIGQFTRQRRRWARGMIEGLREYGLGLLGRRRSYAHGIAVDYAFPYVDAAYSLAFLPGIVLAAFGNFAIVGPMTLAVLPLNLTLATVMYLRQHRMFRELGLKERRNRVGFVAYVLVYQVLSSPVALWGYAQEATGRRARW
jgi:poly-beta-1,6-N-acetyl-D-glucosamine synthase